MRKINNNVRIFMTAVLVCDKNKKIYYLDPNVKGRVFENKTALVNYLVSHSAREFSDGGAARTLEESWQTKRVWFRKNNGEIIEIGDLQKKILKGLHNGEYWYFRKNDGEIIEIGDLLREIWKGRVFTSDDGALWYKYKDKDFWSKTFYERTIEYGSFIDMRDVLKTKAWHRSYWFHDKGGRSIDVSDCFFEADAEKRRRRRKWKKLRRRTLSRPSRGTRVYPHSGRRYGRFGKNGKAGFGAYLRDFNDERILRISNQYQHFFEYFEFFEYNSRWEYDDLGNHVWVCGNPAWVCEDYLENKDYLESHASFWTFYDDEGNLLYRWTPRRKQRNNIREIRWNDGYYCSRRSFGWKDHKCRHQWEHRVREQEKHRKNRERKAVRRKGRLTGNESDSESLI